MMQRRGRLDFEEEDDSSSSYRVVNIFRYVIDDAYVAQVGAGQACSSAFDLELLRMSGAERIRFVCSLHPRFSHDVMRGIIYQTGTIHVNRWQTLSSGAEMIAEYVAEPPTRFASSTSFVPKPGSHENAPLLGGRGFYVDRFNIGMPMWVPEQHQERGGKPPADENATAICGYVMHKSILQHEHDSTHFELNVNGRELVSYTVSLWTQVSTFKTVAAFVQEGRVTAIVPVIYKEPGPRIEYEGVQCELDKMDEDWDDRRDLHGIVAAISDICVNETDAHQFIALQSSDVTVLCTIPATSYSSLVVGQPVILTQMSHCHHTDTTEVIQMDQATLGIDVEPPVVDMDSLMQEYAVNNAAHLVTVEGLLELSNRMYLYQRRFVTVHSHCIWLDEETGEWCIGDGVNAVVRGLDTDENGGGFSVELRPILTSILMVYRPSLGDVKYRVYEMNRG
jgi:hypothetical protein